MDFLREYVIGYSDDELDDDLGRIIKLFGFTLACIICVGMVGVTITHWH